MPCLLCYYWKANSTNPQKRVFPHHVKSASCHRTLTGQFISRYMTFARCKGDEMMVCSQPLPCWSQVRRSANTRPSAWVDHQYKRAATSTRPSGPHVVPTGGTAGGLRWSSRCGGSRASTHRVIQVKEQRIVTSEAVWPGLITQL